MGLRRQSVEVGLPAAPLLMKKGWTFDGIDISQYVVGRVNQVGMHLVKPASLTDETAMLDLRTGNRFLYLVVAMYIDRGR